MKLTTLIAVTTNGQTEAVEVWQRQHEIEPSNLCILLLGRVVPAQTEQVRTLATVPTCRVAPVS